MNKASPLVSIEGEGEAIIAARLAALNAPPGSEVDKVAFIAYNAVVTRAVNMFQLGTLSRSNFEAFLLRNGFTKDSARAEIEFRIEETKQALAMQRKKL